MFGSNVLKGLFLLARGKASGIAEFGNSTDALLASLAPLIAFPLVLMVIDGLQGQVMAALVLFLAQICSFLAISVLTQGFAALAGRDALWVRTATALNWSVWFIVLMILVANMVQLILVAAGVPQQLAFEILICGLGLYLFWYHWFMVRIGLQVQVMSAIGIVLVTNLVVGLLSVGPALIEHLMAGF
jgi:hypothetical protein